MLNGSSTWPDENELKVSSKEEYGVHGSIRQMGVIHNLLLLSWDNNIIFELDGA